MTLLVYRHELFYLCSRQPTISLSHIHQVLTVHYGALILAAGSSENAINSQ